MSGLRGESGIGTLIIFIAVVLVAAIAASVLLGTTGSLQQRALTTGKQTERDVSGGLVVVTMAASDGSNGTVDTFELYVKLTAGSDPISLMIHFSPLTRRILLRVCLITILRRPRRLLTLRMPRWEENTSMVTLAGGMLSS